MMMVGISNKILTARSYYLLRKIVRLYGWKFLPVENLRSWLKNRERKEGAKGEEFNTERDERRKYIMEFPCVLCSGLFLTHRQLMSSVK